MKIFNNTLYYFFSPLTQVDAYRPYRIAAVALAALVFPLMGAILVLSLFHVGKAARQAQVKETDEVANRYFSLQIDAFLGRASTLSYSKQAKRTSVLLKKAVQNVALQNNPSLGALKTFAREKAALGYTSRQIVDHLAAFQIETWNEELASAQPQGAFVGARPPLSSEEVMRYLELFELDPINLDQAGKESIFTLFTDLSLAASLNQCLWDNSVWRERALVNRLLSVTRLLSRLSHPDELDALLRKLSSQNINTFSRTESWVLNKIASDNYLKAIIESLSKRCGSPLLLRKFGEICGCLQKAQQKVKNPCRGGDFFLWDLERHHLFSHDDSIWITLYGKLIHAVTGYRVEHIDQTVLTDEIAAISLWDSCLDKDKHMFYQHYVALSYHVNVKSLIPLDKRLELGMNDDALDDLFQTVFQEQVEHVKDRPLRNSLKRRLLSVIPRFWQKKATLAELGQIEGTMICSEFAIGLTAAAFLEFERRLHEQLGPDSPPLLEDVLGGRFRKANLHTGAVVDLLQHLMDRGIVSLNRN